MPHGRVRFKRQFRRSEGCWLPAAICFKRFQAFKLSDLFGIMGLPMLSMKKEKVNQEKVNQEKEKKEKVALISVSNLDEHLGEPRDMQKYKEVIPATNKGHVLGDDLGRWLCSWRSVLLALRGPMAQWPYSGIVLRRKRVTWGPRACEKGDRGSGQVKALSAWLCREDRDQWIRRRRMDEGHAKSAELGRRGLHRGLCRLSTTVHRRIGRL